MIKNNSAIQINPSEQEDRSLSIAYKKINNESDAVDQLEQPILQGIKPATGQRVLKKKTEKVLRQLIPVIIYSVLQPIEEKIRPKIKGYKTAYLLQMISIVAWHIRKDKGISRLQMEYLKKQVPQGDKYLIYQNTWFGDYKHKGLGIFSFSSYRFQLSETHNTAIKIISPIHVTGGQLDFALFAKWANNRNDPDGKYIGQVRKAVHHYDQLLNNLPTILTGDFNSNKIWDKHHRIANHSAVVAKLADKNIFLRLPQAFRSGTRKRKSSHFLSSTQQKQAISY